MKVLFLDIDGVLNSHAFFKRKTSATRAAELRATPEQRTAEEHARAMIDPAAVALLNEIVERTGAKIVVSSSWRIAYSLGQICRALRANGFQHWRAVIDATPRGRVTASGLEFGAARGHEIDAWLTEHPEVTAFAILDDDGDMAMHVGRLVQTSYGDGLTAKHAERIVEMLGAAAQTQRGPK